MEIKSIIEGMPKDGDILLLKRCRTYVYKYEYINTENEISSTIHESHRGIHKMSSEYQLRELLKRM